MRARRKTYAGSRRPPRSAALAGSRPPPGSVALDNPELEDCYLLWGEKRAARMGGWDPFVVLSSGQQPMSSHLEADLMKSVVLPSILIILSHLG